MHRTRRGFTLVELLVVIAIIGLLLGLLLGAVQQVREAANRVRCQNNLRQLGIALLHYHDARGGFPAGMVSPGYNVSDAVATGFTTLLPYLEQEPVHQLYHFDKPWWEPENYVAVGTQVKTFFCPSNRSSGTLPLGTIAAQWGTALPPEAATCDYAFSKGSNAALFRDGNLTPLATRGVFGVRTPDELKASVRLTDIGDGTSNTFALGDAAGGSPFYLARSLSDPSQPAVNPLTGQAEMLEQSWGAAGAGDPGHPYYGSVFAVTAQYGLAPDPRDEPMNRRPGTPTVFGGDPFGDNRTGRDWVSGFRSLHKGGCNFVFCDASTHFVRESVAPDVYRALSTYAGDEPLRGSDF